MLSTTNKNDLARDDRHPVVQRGNRRAANDNGE